jgi:hypothetical protein
LIPADIVLYITGFIIFYNLAKDSQKKRGLPSEEVPVFSMMQARILYALLWPIALAVIIMGRL